VIRAVLLLLAILPGAVGAQRSVAITVDDLPVSGPRWSGNDLATVQRLNRAMIEGFRRHGVPAVGFVNEIRLEPAEEREARVDLLRAWIAAGLELGNHTYSHPDLNNTPLAAYQEDVLRGEGVIRPLVESRGDVLRYFRLPYTHSGPTREGKAAFEDFLADHGYVNAPFTIENVDYAFNVVLADAKRRGDAWLAARVGDAYLAHLDTVFAYAERLSVATFGREIPQILLIHVNHPNADLVDHLLDRIKRRGYRFVTLEDALADPAYATPDDYVGRSGPSWLHRWRVALALPRRTDEPDPPAWVLQRYAELVRR
jgi:peptidoglycan/xylan/chitin deacetylase (PgdA/CDA1 family)